MMSKSQMKSLLQNISLEGNKAIERLNREYEAEENRLLTILKSVRSRNLEHFCFNNLKETSKSIECVEHEIDNHETSKGSRSSHCRDLSVLSVTLKPNKASPPRTTLRPRRLKVGVDVQNTEMEISSSTDTPLQPKVFKMPLQRGRRGSALSSEHSRKHYVNTSIHKKIKKKPDAVSWAAIQADTSSRYQLRSSKRSAMCIKEMDHQGTCLASTDSPSSAKESIGANRTYVLAKPTSSEETIPKESIGANNTYVLAKPISSEETIPKESIGANSTYVLAKPISNEETIPKESIGANNTYVLAKPISSEETIPKESIGANSTYVLAKPISNEETILKESIGANSTFVIAKTTSSEETNLKDSIGADSTNVITMETSSGNNQAIVQSIADDQSSDKKFKRQESKLAIRIARKSLKSAKVLAVKKLKDNYECKLRRYCGKSMNEEDHLTKLVSKALDWKAKTQSKKTISPKPRKTSLLLGGESTQDVKLTEVEQSDQRSICENSKKNYTQNIAQLGSTFLSKPVEKIHHGHVFHTFKEQHTQFEKIFGSSSSLYDVPLKPDDCPYVPKEDTSDYGFDDSQLDDVLDDSNPKKAVPEWAKVYVRTENLSMQYEITSFQTSYFFESKKSTPDLRKMFSKIDNRLLVRRSSAEWKSP